jgi:hypothetical protein
MDLRKIHYNVMCRVMEMSEADILVGRAKSVAARHYVMYELDKMVLEYFCMHGQRSKFLYYDI